MSIKVDPTLCDVINTVRITVNLSTRITHHMYVIFSLDVVYTYTHFNKIEPFLTE